MKTATEVSPEKLRGGFYTPDPLVDFCLAKLAGLVPADRPLNVLEPSAGDGAFLRGLQSRWPGSGKIDDITAVELVETEAARCRKLLPSSRGSVVTASVVQWALDCSQHYAAAVGNPPFVRFQFVSDADRSAAADLADRLGLSIRGVANLWIPVLLASISRLRRGGAFAFVVPTECLTGTAAGRLREWLLAETSDLGIDLFPPNSFPVVLQEVAVLSGILGRPKSRSLTITQHRLTAPPETWTVEPPPSRASWTSFLLESVQRDALADIAARPFIHRLGDLARFEVSIVTGANGFFAVDDETLAGWDLDHWAEPLLSRIRYAPGLVFRKSDHRALRREGVAAWLLNFSAERLDPVDLPRPGDYISQGEDEELHQRFKCRIREPWYRVPNFQRGALLLSKRSHLFPRLVLNEACAYTTDTIYRGRLLPGSPPASAIAAGFHSSLTAVSAELEGRSFGGGVLELVPSEVSKLLVPRVDAASTWLDHLDRVAREGPPERLIEATDQALVEAGVLGKEDVEILASARELLLARRIDRSSAASSTGEPLAQVA